MMRGQNQLGAGGRRDGKRIARHPSWVEIGRGGDRKAASLVLKQSRDNREFVIGKENMR